MKFLALTFLLLGFIVNPFSAWAQDELQAELDALNAELDAIFANEEDSISLVSLMDSILSLPQYNNEIQVRIAYSSRVTSAGRDFGIDQQGLAPGLSYYHKSGIFADLTGFWNSEFDPKYNLTVATAGYLGKLAKNTTFGLTYDHSFYSEYDSLNTLTNSLSASTTQYFKRFYTGVDYSFSFGAETAHRVVWNLTGNFNTKRKVGPFSRISILPSLSILFGNQNITQQYVNAPALDRFANLTERQLRRYAFQNNLSRAEYFLLQDLQQDVRNGTLGTIQQEIINEYFATEQNVESFELLNYYLALPIVFYLKDFSFYVSYNYNIPRNFSDEYTYDSNLKTFLLTDDQQSGYLPLLSVRSDCRALKATL